MTRREPQAARVIGKGRAVAEAYNLISTLNRASLSQECSPCTLSKRGQHGWEDGSDGKVLVL